jgi:hypothetical protein
MKAQENRVQAPLVEVAAVVAGKVAAVVAGKVAAEVVQQA